MHKAELFKSALPNGNLVTRETHHGRDARAPLAGRCELRTSGAREYRERQAARGVEFTRYYPINDVRANEGDGKLLVEGYAAVFNVRSEPIWGMFVETIKPGAFANTLRSDDVLAFWNHDSNEVLGRRSNNTLTLEEDAHGLKFRLEMANTTRGRDAYENIRRGDVKEMSFGFRVMAETWTVKGADPYDLRELVEVQLGEISPVPFPAYAATEVEARSVYDRSEVANKRGSEVAGPAWDGVQLGLMKRRLDLLAIE